MRSFLLRNPYLRLMRLDKPTGIWLVLWPGWWGLTLASYAPAHDAYYYLLFALGAVVMRSAGCVVNDILDREIDPHVSRTQNRPLASGELSVRQAAILLILLLLAGLVVLLQLSTAAILTGLAFVLPVLLYPLAKRVMRFPQAILALTINGGALIGWAALSNDLALPGWLLFFACFFWTLAYDTIYAHQDKKDDAVLGIGSSALVLGKSTKPFLLLCFTLMLFCLALCIHFTVLHWYSYIGLAFAYSHMLWQVRDLHPDIPSDCHRKFRSNITLGGIVLASLMLGHFV